MSRWGRLAPYCAVLAVGLGLTAVPKAPAAETPAPPPPTTFTFTAGGDMGYNPIAAKTLKAVASPGVDFSLHLGDMAYDQIYPESAWCDFIKDPKNGVGPNFPYEIVTGGHDLGAGPGPAAQYRTLIDKYVTCLPDHMGSTGTYGKEYFFDHPAAAPLMRVIMISPSMTMPDGTLYDYSPGTVHWQWLVDAIDGARAAGIRWITVGMARNCISTGEKGCEIGPDVFNMLVDKRVDLAACLADDGSGSIYVKGEGPIVVIAGTLGIGMRPMNAADSEIGDFSTFMGSNINRTHGFVKYTVSTERIQAQFVPTTPGGFADQFTIADPHPDAPLPPLTLSAPTTAPAAAAPVVPTAVTAEQRTGYWMLGADGAVYPFGQAGKAGGASVGAARSAVDIEPTPSGRGYWVLDDSGTVSPFGDARFAGSMGDRTLNAPVQSLVPDADGRGYWLVASDGGIFAFDAPFKGSMGGQRLAEPITGMVRYGDGYLITRPPAEAGTIRTSGADRGRPVARR